MGPCATSVSEHLGPKRIIFSYLHMFRYKNGHTVSVPYENYNFIAKKNKVEIQSSYFFYSNICRSLFVANYVSKPSSKH